MCTSGVFSSTGQRSPVEKTRYDTSLGLLTKKFVGLLRSSPDGVCLYGFRNQFIVFRILKNLEAAEVWFVEQLLRTARTPRVIKLIFAWKMANENRNLYTVVRVMRIVLCLYNEKRGIKEGRKRRWCWIEHTLRKLFNSLTRHPFL